MGRTQKDNRRKPEIGGEGPTGLTKFGDDFDPKTWFGGIDGNGTRNPKKSGRHEGSGGPRTEKR